MLLCFVYSQGDAIDNTEEEQPANNAQVNERLYAVRLFLYVACNHYCEHSSIYPCPNFFCVGEYPKNPDSFHMIGSVGKRRKDILWKSAQSFVCVECGCNSCDFRAITSSCYTYECISLRYHSQTQNPFPNPYYIRDPPNLRYNNELLIINEFNKCVFICSQVSQPPATVPFFNPANYASTPSPSASGRSRQYPRTKK